LFQHDISRVDKELRKPNFRKAEAFDDTIEHWVRYRKHLMILLSTGSGTGSI